MGLQGYVLDRPLSAVEIVEPDDVGAGEELIIALGVVHAAVVLVPAAGVRFGQIKNAPIRDTVGPIADSLPWLGTWNVKPAKSVVWNQGATVSLVFPQRLQCVAVIPGVLNNLGGDAAGIRLYDILLELRRFERHRTHWHCVLEPDSFIGEEKEETILDNRTADAAGVVSIFLVGALRTVAGGDCELARAWRLRK